MFVPSKRLFILLCLVSISVQAVPFYNRFDRDHTVKFLKQFIHPNSLVFDVGANKGDKTDVYLACGARVVCFEPQPQCVEQLHKRFNGNHRVAIESVGLAEKEGALELMICDQASTLSTFNKNATQSGRFADRDYKWGKSVAVDVVTLDAMIKKYGMPDFCKIDVENFELNVLQGLSKHIPCLSFECNSEYMQQTFDCVDCLSSLGYKKFNFCIGETSKFHYDDWLDPKDFKAQISILAKSHDWSEIWGLWGDVYAFIE